jgi:hypothetical protein
VTRLHPFVRFKNPLPQSTVSVLDKFLGKSEGPLPTSPEGEESLLLEPKSV